MSMFLLIALPYPCGSHNHYLILQLISYHIALMIMLLELSDSPDFMSDPLCFHLFSSFSPQVLRVGLVLVELDWDLFGSTWIWIAEVKFSLSFSLWLFVVVGLCTLFYQDGYYVLDFGLWFLMM